MSLMASSAVCSPHSDSWVAIETRSLAAASWAAIRLFSDLMSRYSRFDSSGWPDPRREDRLKPRRPVPPVLPPPPPVWRWWPWDEVEEEWVVPPLLRLLVRMESARFLCRW